MSRTAIILVFCLLLLILFFRFLFFYQNQPQYADGQEVAFATILFSEPQMVGSQQRLSANLGNQRIFIRAALHPQFHYGDIIKISGILKVRSIDSKTTIMVMYFPKIEFMKKDFSTPLGALLATASLVRQKTTSIFKMALPPTSSSLLLGIVFGIKEEIPKSFLENLRISGVMHVITASGMNVTMVGVFLNSLFGFFLKRQIALTASIIGVLFYALLAGLEPSIIRASIMGILVFVSQILGRQNLGAYALFIAGFAMLFVSPNTLFDIGFQLSFLATLGLLYIKPLFEKDKKTKRLLKKSLVGESAITTISAQAATLPILMSSFGNYSVWSILVNALVLWTVPILMIVGGLGAIVGFISVFFSQVILYFSMPLLFYFERIVNLFVGFGGMVGIATLPWQLAVGYYSLLLTLVLIFKKK